MNDKVKCPKCGSEQISADKKGFSGAKAVAGAVVAGPLGIAAGTLGSNKVKITCLNCGNVFSPGDKPVPKNDIGIGGGIFVIVFSVVAVLFLMWLMGMLSGVSRNNHKLGPALMGQYCPQQGRDIQSGY